MSKKAFLIIGYVSGVLGVVLLLLFLIPFIEYSIYAKQKFPVLISPLSQVEPLNTSSDLSQAQNWFPDANNNDFASTQTVDYFMTIPKLKITNAKVIINSNDLSKSLIHFPKTGLPGKIGNAVVFGHSVLPVFFNSKNYMTIFSTLQRLDPQDEIFVDYDGIKYTYVVESMFEVLPTDVQILDQEMNGSYLSLVTCSPPGHPGKPRRLIVRARLKSV